MLIVVTMRDMPYFPLLYRFQGEERYLIWIGDEQDSIAVDLDGCIPSFGDSPSLRQYADLKNYVLETEDPVMHDLDWVQARCSDQTLPISCETTLAAWNLFGDVAASIGSAGADFQAIDAAAVSTYRKLFWGNNLPSVTPAGQHYIPEWTAEDIQDLSIVLRAGLGLFKSRTLHWSGK